MHVYVMIILHLLLLTTIVESSTVTLTQISPHGVTVCPGQDLVYNCTSTVSANLNLFWIYFGDDGIAVMLLNTIDISENIDISFGPFTVRVLQRTFDPIFRTVSTATLNSALLSHNNININCTNAVANAAATILISGAISRPTNLTLVPQSSTSISLSWSSPDNNCMFSYVVNGSNNGSVAQYRTNTTSLIITGLSVAMMYHFAVAVEDANLTTGHWSEVIDILWDVPQLAAFNISIVTMMDFLSVNWTVPQIKSTLVTYYILTHNLTATGSTTIINNASPLVIVSLDGVPPGHYSVNVTAVNIVGLGTSAQETVTVILSSTSAGIAVTSTYSAKSSPIENGVSRSSSRGVPNASTADTSSVTLTSMSELTPSLPTMPMPVSGSTTTVIAASLGVIFVISIALVITITGTIICLRNRRIIVWCVMRRRRPSSHATATTDHDKEQVTELATVIYDTPNVIKEHTITTQDNLAYGGTIPLKHNEAYQQVYTN